MDPQSWAVLFDVDGTMVDNGAHHEAAWVELGRRHNLGITPEFYRQRLHARTNLTIVTALFGAATTPDLIARIGDEKERIYREGYGPVMKEVPGLGPLLTALRAASARLATVSNSPPANVDLVLDGLGIRSHFHTVVNADDVRHGKPDPEAFLTAAARLGVPIGRCVVVEDSASGFAAAERAGAPYVAMAVDGGARLPASATRARRVCRDFTGLTVDMLRGIACEARDE
jgi:HAD superfamily hydrolase (TIGR01509 family)